jgi:hypothetical protein
VSERRLALDMQKVVGSSPSFALLNPQRRGLAGDRRVGGMAKRRLAKSLLVVLAYYAEDVAEEAALASPSCAAPGRR